MMGLFAEAERDRLKSKYDLAVEGMAARMAVQEAEVARLREALESIARTSQAPAVAIARAALAAPTKEGT